MTNLNNTRVRSVRTELNEKMIVESKTIGANLTFPFTSENISKSGMLLAWNSPHKAPFQEKTILHLTIDPNNAYLEKPLFCLGQVVRKFSESEETDKYGVRIIQMEPKDISAWESIVNALEASDDHKSETYSTEKYLTKPFNRRHSN